MIFDFGRPLQPPPHLQWRYADEPALLAWTIKARNYNTLVANYMFGFMLLVDLVATYAIYAVRIPGGSDFKHLMICFGFFVLMAFTISLMTHQRMNFAYRFTQSGLEFCKWKGLSKFSISFMEWFSVATTAMFLFLTTIDSTFLIGALVGPGGVGIAYLIMANSKSYRELHTTYHHIAFKWSDFKRIDLDKRRGLIDLPFDYLNSYVEKIVEGRCYLFCRKDSREEILRAVESCVPQPLSIRVISVPVY